MSLETFYKRWIQTPYRYLLAPLACLYAIILFLRRYSLIPKKSSAYVISIGNLDFGGTGKTPFLLYLLPFFAKHKRAILTRGYRSQFETRGATWVNPLINHPDRAALIGDEATLYLEHEPGVLLYVGKDREYGLAEAESENVELVFLEDGAQFLKIEKDIEILLLDPKEPIKPLCPVGYRRDVLTPLTKADFIVFPYVQNETEYTRAKERVRPYTQAPICGFKAILETGKLATRVALLCGIANPQRLLEQLEKAGVHVVYAFCCEDHAYYTDLQIVEFFNTASEQGALECLCTEKDFVKLKTDQQKNFTCLKLTLEPAYDQEAWESFIGKIGQNLLS